MIETYMLLEGDVLRRKVDRLDGLKAVLATWNQVPVDKLGDEDISYMQRLQKRINGATLRIREGR